MHRATFAMILALIPGLVGAASYAREPLSQTDEASALVAAQRLFGNAKPKLELIDSGEVFKGGLYAYFASPEARVSERLSTYTRIHCRTNEQAWACALLSFPDARFISNGIEHRNSLRPDTQADELVEVADFIYSKCFRLQLERHPDASRLAVPKRITSISQRGARFSVQGFSNRVYEISRERESESGCKFKLVGVGMWVQ